MAYLRWKKFLRRGRSTAPSGAVDFAGSYTQTPIPPEAIPMPVHHVPRASLDEALRELTRTGEQVVSIILDDDDRYEVNTRFAAANERTETRPA